MELKDIIKFFKKYKIKISLNTLLLAILGAISYFLIPTTYISAGSLFVGREIQPLSDEFFTYEGFYSQQAASSYTNSIVGLIESEDIGAKVLTETGTQVNNTNLRKYFRKVRVKRIGPQVITILVKDKSAHQAQQIWHSISNNITLTASKLNAANDNALDVQKVSETPIVTETYKSIWINTAAGIILGFLGSIVIFSLKEYLAFGSAERKEYLK